MEKVLYILSQAAPACLDAGWYISSVMYENPSLISTSLISRAKQDPMDVMAVARVIFGQELGGNG